MRVDGHQNGRLRAAIRTIIGANGTRGSQSLSTRKLEEEKKRFSLPVIPVELQHKNDKVRVNYLEFLESTKVYDSSSINKK